MKFLISFLYLSSFISVSYSLSDSPTIINNRVPYLKDRKEDNLGPIKEAFEEIVKDLLVFSKKIAETYKTKSVKDDDTSKANIVKAIQFHLRTINLIADEVDLKLLPLLQQASDKSKRPKRSPNVAAQWNGEIFWKHPSVKISPSYKKQDSSSFTTKDNSIKDNKVFELHYVTDLPYIPLGETVKIPEKLTPSKSDYHAHPGRSKPKTTNYVSMSVSMKEGGKHSPPKSPLPLSPNPIMMAPRTMIYGP
uniref:Secreted protein n=1 Tax=Strongyloides papillosus TaxID=174720 RepID=A0A0N5C2J7_STREA